MGHYIAAKMTNASLVSFKMSLFGVNMQINTSKLIAEEKVFLYYAGPFINLLLAIYARIIGVLVIQQINLFLLFLNIIPIVPLDGGNILKTVLQLYFSDNIVYMINLTTNIIFLIISLLCFYQSKNIIFIAIFIFCIKGIIDEKNMIIYNRVRASYEKFIK